MDKTAGSAGGMSPAIKKATLLPLIGITYCMVAGGPYGLEGLIGKSGYRNAIILLLVTPLLWSFPVTLMVSELSAAMPEDGGYYVWVRRAMGPFWGFQEAWLSIASSVFDMALYPTLFIGYLARLWPAAGGPTLSTLIGVVLIAACVGINLAGVRSVGGGSLGMTLALLLPFVVAVVLTLSRHPLPVQESAEPVKDATWLGGIFVVMWNYMGWDNTSTIAGEVDRPQRTYPLAMLLSVLLVAATYILPVAVASRSGISAQNWDDGWWVNWGRAVGNGIGPRAGTALAVAITAGGMISAFSIFNALILSYSRLPVAMVADGFLPKFMGLRTRRTGVPWVAVLVCAVAWGLCMKLGFGKLVMLDTILYAVSLILEFAALIALRVREPNLPRPYKVPGGMIGCVVISVLPLAIMGVAFHEALSDESAHKGLQTAAILTLLGPILYLAALWINPRLRRQRTGSSPQAG
jgi:amino acid transporter